MLIRALSGNEKNIVTNGRSAVLRRILIFLFLAVAISGCSRFKMLYSLGSEVIQREAEYYLDLTEEEEAALSLSVESLVLWHRRMMLPRYAAFLKEAAVRLDEGQLGRPAVEAMIVRMRRLLKETIGGAAPIIAGVLVSHTAPQKVAHLRDRIDERLLERRGEDETEQAEWVQERTERAAKRFESLCGELLLAQEAIVRRYFEGKADSRQRWQEMREKRQRALVNFLTERPNRQSIDGFLPRILFHSEEIVGPEYKALADTWWARFTGWFVEIEASLSPAQRAHLAKTLREYANDMIDLAA